MRVLVTAMLLLLAAAPATASDLDNAAEWYRRAIAKLDRVTDAEWQAVRDYLSDPGAEPPAQIRDLVRRTGPALNLVRRGSLREYADYDLDYGLGPGLTLPHLGQLRNAARLMSTDALVRLHDGDARGAAGRLGTVYRMSSHFGDDGTVISSLVGQAVFETADRVTRRAIDNATLDAGASATLLRAAERLDAMDPFGAVEAVAGEQQWLVMWMEHEMAADDPERPSWLDQLGWIEDEETARLAELDPESLQAEVETYDALMGEMVAAFEMEDAEEARARIDELEQELLDGEHGLLASMLMPALGRVHDRMIEARGDLARRVEILEELSRGTTAPEELANAALDYLRGIELLGKLPPEKLDALRRLAGDAEAPIDETLLEALVESEAAIAAFRAGSQRRRCDFSIARGRGWNPRIAPAYLAGMRDAVRVLHADGIRLRREGAADGLTDRLGICYRMVGHLSGDEPITGALVAHVAFLRTHELAAASLELEVLDANRRRTLLGAFQRIGQTDPFGYVGAVGASRAALARYIASRLPEGDEPAAARADKLAAALGGDELLYLETVVGAMADARTTDGSTDWTAEALSDDARLGPLGDVLSAEAIEQTRAHVELVAPALARGDLIFLTGRAIPDIGKVDQRMRKARRDLRDGMALLAKGTEGQRE